MIDMTRILIGLISGICSYLLSMCWAHLLLKHRGYHLSLSKKICGISCLIFLLFGVFIVLNSNSLPYIICSFALLSVCSCVSITDCLYRIIPNPIVLSVFGIKGMMIIGSFLKLPELPAIRWISSLVGFVICFIIFLLPGIIGGKQVGAGDVKLAAAMGFFYHAPKFT